MSLRVRRRARASSPVSRSARARIASASSGPRVWSPAAFTIGIAPLVWVGRPWRWKRYGRPRSISSQRYNDARPAVLAPPRRAWDRLGVQKNWGHLPGAGLRWFIQALQQPPAANLT